LLANGVLPVRFGADPEERPLPNPLPEGRGDRWAESGVLESAGNTEGFRLKPSLLSARTSPLSLQGEGWGEGAESTQRASTTGRPGSRASSLLRKANQDEQKNPPPRPTRDRGRKRAVKAPSVTSTYFGIDRSGMAPVWLLRQLRVCRKRRARIRRGQATKLGTAP